MDPGALAKRLDAIAMGNPFVNAIPRVLSIITFLSGTILLFSGATPAAAGRLALLNSILPLGIIETSHFLGSLVGVALLLLAQGLARRLDAAYFFTVIALATGIVTSLLKGADYEAATVLAVVLMLLWHSRAAFNRRAALFETRFSAGWLAAIALSIAASIWLGLFAYKHVEYSSQLWWEFELHGEASRFLRATVGVAIGLVLLTLTRLLRNAPHELEMPTDAQLAEGRRDHRRSGIFVRVPGLPSRQGHSVRRRRTRVRHVWRAGPDVGSTGAGWPSREARMLDSGVHRTLR